MKQARRLAVLCALLAVILVLGVFSPAVLAAEGDGTIRLVVASLGATMDPHVNGDATVSMMHYATYDRLVKYGAIEKDGILVADQENIQPSIAKSWEVSEDQTEWTFHIDERATFADGTPVKASDVKFSFERLKSIPKSEFIFGLTNIETIETPDDMTVVFKLKTHTPIFLKLIEVYYFSIINENAYNEQENPDEYMKTNTLGSGPYSLEKYDLTSEVILVARNDYWNERAKNNRVLIKWNKEPSNRQLLLEKGDVDIALDLTETEVVNVRDKEGINVTSVSMPKILYFSMNSNIEPFDNVLVRQAIAYAIPYDTLVTGVMNDTVTNPKSFIPASMPGHIENENTHYTYNLEKAKELLTEAGYEDGFSFDFTLGSGFQDWEDTAILIQAELVKLNIDMKINRMERAQYMDLLSKREVPAYFSRFLSFVNDPGYLSGLLFYSGGSYNSSNYKSDEFDVRYLQSIETVDEEARLAIFGEMQEVYKNDIPCIPIFEYGNHFCARDNVKGYVAHNDAALRLESLFIEE